MRIILLTDLHLTFKGQLSDRGIDVNQQFLNVLSHLKTISFDHIIILGDICYNEPEYEIYDWFLDEVENLNKPFDIIAGNHDNSELMIQILDLPTVHTYDKQIFVMKNLAGRKCFFLDTSSGEIKGQQLDWLKDKLINNTEDILVFMHHPPCNGKVPFMDINHKLKNKTEVFQLFKQDYNIDVFYG